MTAQFADDLKKPWIAIHPLPGWESALIQWLDTVRPETLNVAGPRASKEPGVGEFATTVLNAARTLFLDKMGESPPSSQKP